MKLLFTEFKFTEIKFSKIHIGNYSFICRRARHKPRHEKHRVKGATFAKMQKVTPLTASFEDNLQITKID